MLYARFKKALQDESVYPATTAIYDFIVNTAEVVILRKNELLIGYDQMDDAIYFIFDGIIRGAIINQNGVERTIAFGECGTLFYSSQCYTLGKPSLISFTACCATTVLRISKDRFDSHLSENHEFCHWFMGALSLAICFKDFGNERLNGDALFKYQWMQEHRPSILKNVSSKILASYLNITEEYLSRIRKQLLKK